MTSAFDCVVIGGGPAGLVAAVYLARFRRSVIVVRDGRPRASWIPRTRNVPAYPDGISGEQLLEQLQRQAELSGASFVDARATRILGIDGAFSVETTQGRLSCKKVILATGVTDIRPHDLGDLEPHIRSGRIRFCPICDAYELRNQPVFVIGRQEHGARAALFLTGYTPHVTLLTHGGGHEALAMDWRRRLAASGIAVIDKPLRSLSAVGKDIAVEVSGDPPRRGRALYIELGVAVHAELARKRGARCNAEGRLKVSERQETSVHGLYAAGDVVQSLAQISVAFGQAAIAAASIHRALLDPKSQEPSKTQRL